MPPEELVLRCQGWKLLLVFVPLFLLNVVSIVLNPSGWLKLDWPLALIVVEWLGFLLLPILVTRRYRLHLSADGLAIHYLIGGRRFYTWDQVENFRVQKMKNPGEAPARANLVVFDLTGRAPPRSPLQRFLRLFNRYDHSIFAAFELNAAEMADLLNEWQQQYGRRAPTVEAGKWNADHLKE